MTTHPTDPVTNAMGSADSYASPPFSVRSFGLTNRGLVRPSNDDQFLIAELACGLHVQQSSLSQPGTQQGGAHGRVYVVADGIGGAKGGDKASVLAVTSIQSFLLNKLVSRLNSQDPATEAMANGFLDTLSQVDAALFAEAASNPELQGMGTTVTLAFSLNSELFIVHVGDSRCYLFRGEQLQQLTRDHNVANLLATQGLFTQEEIDRYKFGHALTQAVGGGTPGVKPDIIGLNITANDVLLLCSDGLSRMVPDDQIAATLQAERDPAVACQHLVDLSLAHGGRDNVTVIMACYEAAAPKA